MSTARIIEKLIHIAASSFADVYTIDSILVSWFHRIVELEKIKGLVLVGRTTYLNAQNYVLLKEPLSFISINARPSTNGIF